MLRRSWQAGLQLVVAIRIATAAVLDRTATRLLNGMYQLGDEKNSVAEPIEKKTAQRRSSPDKWLLREEVAVGEEAPQRRGCSVKK